MPKNQTKNRKKTHNYNPYSAINNPGPKTTAWSNAQSGIKINPVVKFASAISVLLSNLPIVKSLPVNQYQEAIYLVNSSLTNIASNWTKTNNTAYCEPTRDKDIETECFAYMNTNLDNIAQAAADVCWKLTADSDNVEPNGADMYKCVKDVIDDYFPKLIDEYGFSAQELVDLCKFDFEIKLDGYGLSSGWVDKVQIYTQVAGQNITDALCKKFEDDLKSHVKDTCDPQKDYSELILAATIIGGILGGCCALNMIAVISKHGYVKCQQWSKNRNNGDQQEQQQKLLV